MKEKFQISNFKVQKIGNWNLKLGNSGRQSSGFTLIELVTGVAMIAVLSLVLSAIIVSAQRSAAVERTRADLVAENRVLVDEVSRHVKSASSVLAASTVLGTNYTTDPETLVLQVPAIDANQNLISNVNDLVVFRKNGSDFEFIQEGGSGSVRPDTDGRILSSRAESLAFTFYDSSGNQLVGSYQNAQSVAIAATLSDTVRTLTVTSTLDDTATLRNR